MKRFAQFLGIAALAVALICAIYVSCPVRPLTVSKPAKVSSTPVLSRDSIVASAKPRPQVDPERPAVWRLDPQGSAAMPRSPLANGLHASTNDGARDVAIVFNLLARYRERFGGFPTGEDNIAFVNALTGNNPLRLAFIERVHPAINPRGELVDRWGKPFFFHLESRDSMQVRSAGPDGEFYTSDDLVKGSPATASL